MKTFLLSLLAAALCLHTAHSLKCYTCAGATNNTECLKEADCAAADKFCMTIVASESGKTGIVKQCMSECTAGKAEKDGKKVSVTCCQTDLCNQSGATSVKISYLALVISVGFVGTLLRAGL